MQLARSFKTKQKYRAHELRLIVIIIIRISRSEASKRNFKEKEFREAKLQKGISKIKNKKKTKALRKNFQKFIVYK